MYSRHQANFHTCTNFDDSVPVHGKHNSVLAASTLMIAVSVDVKHNSVLAASTFVMMINLFQWMDSTIRYCLLRPLSPSVSLNTCIRVSRHQANQ